MEDKENRVYVAVDARIDKTGRMRPLRIIWEDGRNFEIQRVVDVVRAESLKASGTGLRYRCIVSGREVYLFFDGARWYVERKYIPRRLS
jgi:hypothetical protein